MKLYFSIIFLFLTSTITLAKESIIDCDKIRDEERICLACNIYHEARNQVKLGQYMVGRVTLNRKRSNLFPNTICEVVWQRNSRGSAQFSWTHDGSHDIVYDRGSWDSAVSVVDMLFFTNDASLYEDILWYHADYVNPTWAKEKKFVMKVDDHLFYR